MRNRSVVDNLRAELQHRGLPAGYVDRVVGELGDHLADVTAEQRAAGRSPDEALAEAAARLGSVEELAGAAVAQYQARTFSGRHPIIAFVIAPIPAVFFSWTATFLLAWSVLYVLDESGAVHSVMKTTPAMTLTLLLMRVFDGVLVFGVPAVVAYGFCRKARRSARGWPWMLAACSLVALVATALHTQLTPPTAGPGTGMYMISLGLFTAAQLPQLLAPLAVAPLFLLRLRSRRRLDLA